MIIRCICFSRELQAFTVLCELYEPSIKRDPCYFGYLDKIGQIFFGLKPPPKSQGLFGNFIESFFSGLDDSDDDNTPQPSTSNIQDMLHQSELD